ncbi:FxDxF family PEP-CTERM protein [Phenylobacterium koreense]
MLMVAPAANAAQFINISAPGPAGTISGAFGYNEIGAGDFSHVFDFNLPAGVSNASIVSSLIFDVAETDINFSSVTLNGVEFNIEKVGDKESRFLDNLAIVAGPQQLIVKGWSGGNGSYGGQLSFAPTGAVPEPATWAMMIIGFGAAGTMVRNRRKLVPSAA